MPLIPQERPKQIALVIVLVSITALYAFYEYWYSPQVEEIERLQSRLTQLEDRNRQAQVTAARGGAELEERLAVYERHVERLEELIPQNEEVPALLNSIVLEARRTGVEMALLNPGGMEPGEFYTQQSYDIAVIGDFHPVGQFLAAVASLSRIITPLDLDVEPFTGTPPRSDMMAPVTARFRVQTYVLPGDGPPPEIPALPNGVNE
ncbi:MAG: type 4a pilus biogenesis protein PilO [Gemmatimonadota bacterium]